LAWVASSFCTPAFMTAPNDEHILPLLISGTLVVIMFSVALVVGTFIYMRKQNEHEREKSKLLIGEQEGTMDHISKEIHDNIGQLLAHLKMNNSALSKHATGERAVNLIENSKTIIDLTITNIRNISHSLNSDYIKLNGLKAVLQQELAYIELSEEIICNLQTVGNTVTLPPGQELLIYRIAQEAIHNVSKHAKATQLQITLTYGAATFTMSISDNGTGFDATSQQAYTGIGFRNMQQRTKLVNGTLSIVSHPAKGTTITLRIADIRKMILTR